MQRHWLPYWHGSRRLPPISERQLRGGARLRQSAWHSWSTGKGASRRFRCVQERNNSKHVSHTYAVPTVSALLVAGMQARHV